MKYDNIVWLITRSGLLISIMVILGQVLRINIGNTTLPLFLLPIFIAPFILNIIFTFLSGFLGHFLVDLTVWGIAFNTSLLWELATGVLSVGIYLVYKMMKNDKKYVNFIKILIIMLLNSIIYSFFGFIDWLITKNSVIWVNQIVFGILIMNNLSIPIFYKIGNKIGKRLRIN